MKKKVHKKRKHSRGFWIAFWCVSFLLLGAWWSFLNRDAIALIHNALSGTNNSAVERKATSASQDGATHVVGEMSEQKTVREDNAPLNVLMRYFMRKDDTERTFLLLLQNDMELRPGGGYIGSFGIVRVRNGEIIGMPEIHDLSNFDGRIPDDEEPPYPMRELLGIDAWKMRDSNWSPDFAVNAQKALHFYYKGHGEEKFDGVIGVTTSILSDLLSITGPITVPGYPGVYDAESGVLLLERQVEQDFVKQGIEKGERKAIMPLLAQAIIDKINFKNPVTLMQLFMLALHALERKDIQLYFTDDALQAQMRAANWTGEVDTQWNKDYIMIVDANLGAFKTDAVIKRSAHYTINATNETSHVTVAITYTHTKKQRDFMTTDYRAYTRVYLPRDAWIERVDGARDTPRFAQAFGKKYVGFITEVPLGTTKTITVHYTLPSHLVKKPYHLKVQKQPGMTLSPFIVDYVEGNTPLRLFNKALDSDTIISTP